uniref:Uncharacterized protein n=1 Tax=Angiostrongylus cantonensis TaxID=6313 RepID=A0A158P6Z0_ANGCA
MLNVIFLLQKVKKLSAKEQQDQTQYGDTIHVEPMKSKRNDYQRSQYGDVDISIRRRPSRKNQQDTCEQTQIANAPSIRRRPSRKNQQDTCEQTQIANAPSMRKRPSRKNQQDTCEQTQIANAPSVRLLVTKFTHLFFYKLKIFAINGPDDEDDDEEDEDVEALADISHRPDLILVTTNNTNQGRIHNEIGEDCLIEAKYFILLHYFFCIGKLIIPYCPGTLESDYNQYTLLVMMG